MAMMRKHSQEEKKRVYVEVKSFDEGLNKLKMQTNLLP